MASSPSFSFGQEWSPSNLSPKSWVAIASSVTGSNIAGLAAQGLFTSRNTGQTWTTNIIPPLPWVGLASSADGSRLIAVSGSPASSQYSYVLVSTNFGSSWTTSNVPWLSSSGALTAVASSADGNTLVVVGSYGRVYMSKDGDSSWEVATNASYGFFSKVACSADGSHIAVIDRGSSAGFLLISTNRGLTWANPPTIPGMNWTALAFSAEAKLFACGGNFSSANLYIIADAGNTWSKLTLPDRPVHSMAVSADGQHLTVSTVKIFESSNGGTNWITNSVPPGGSRLTVSADFGKRAAAELDTGILFLSGTIQPPTIILKSDPGVSLLSWVVPSSEFVLEETLHFNPVIWSPVTNLLSLNASNLRYEVALPATGDNKFYRLRKE